MTTSSVSLPGTAIISALTTAAQNAAQSTQQQQLNEISQDLQNQLNQKLAALQEPVDQVSVNYSQSQITALQNQQTTITNIEKTYSTNALNLGDLVNQISAMNKAIANGDSAGFDTALNSANGDVNNLTIASYNGMFQPDGVNQLKTNGLGIQSSATYDLSTTAGQNAASAAVSAAQNVVNQVFKMTTDNQIIAGGQVMALNGQISALQSLQNQQQQANSAQVTSETQQLEQNEQEELHVIELNIGQSSATNATALSYMISSSDDSTTTSSSQSSTSSPVFGALENAVGETASTAEEQLNTNPAVLSIFA